MSNIHRLPTALGHPQASCPYDWPAPGPDIEVTAGLRKVYAVRIGGGIWAEFNTDTMAARCMTLLNGLAEIGALPTPQDVARRMLAASVAEINAGDRA